MGYIVNLKRWLTESEERKISNEDVFISKVLPIIIIRNISKELEQADFVKNIREEATGELQSFDFIPCVNENILRSRCMIGWGINVAVIDSGVRKSEVDNVVKEIDCFNIGKVNTEDLFGHGTVVAATINKCAPRASITNIKITETPQLAEGNVIKALEEVYFDDNINIVNMSLSIGRTVECDGTCEICQFVHLLTRQGKIVVTSAGNAGPAIGTINCPGGAEDAITVGAIDVNNNIAGFSSRGRIDQGKPNILAAGYNNYRDNRFRAGTSFSAPIISGVCACIFDSCNRDINRLKDILYSGVTTINACPHEQGHGVLNISKLLEVLDNEKIHSESL